MYRATTVNSTLRIYGTPTNSYVGTFPVSVRASDNYGKFSVYNFTVVINTNNPVAYVRETI